MRIIVEKADGTQEAPLILIDVDNGKGLVPIQQIFQQILADLDELQILVHAPHATTDESRWRHP